MRQNAFIVVVAFVVVWLLTGCEPPRQADDRPPHDHLADGGTDCCGKLPAGGLNLGYTNVIK